MNTSTATHLPEPLYDVLLRRAPVNVFLFDTDLVCRYAAPVGDALLGQPREALLGRPAAEVLPPAANGLGPVLERVARDAKEWRNPEYRFTHRINGEVQSCCWSVHVEPIEMDDYQGVLLSWSDILEEAQERQSLRAEIQSLHRQAEERNAALTVLLSDLRNAVTPLSGYLQVIARRPEMLAGRSVAEVITRSVLPRIGDILDATDRLRRPPIYAPERNGATNRPGAP